MDLKQAFSIDLLEEACGVEDDLRFRLCEALRSAISLNPPEVHLTIGPNSALLLADILEDSLMNDLLSPP